MAINEVNNATPVQKVGNTQLSVQDGKLKIKSNSNEYILEFDSKEDLNEVYLNADKYFNDMAKPVIAKNLYRDWQYSLEIKGKLPEGTNIKAADGQNDLINIKVNQKHITINTGDKRDTIYAKGVELESSSILLGDGHDSFTGSLTGYGVIFAGKGNDNIKLKNSKLLMADLGNLEDDPRIDQIFSGYANSLVLENSTVDNLKAGYETFLHLTNSKANKITGKKLSIIKDTNSSFTLLDDDIKLSEKTLK